MSNLKRGQVTIELGSKKYPVRFNFTAIIMLEEHFGKPITQIFKEDTLSNLSGKDLLAIFHAAIAGGGAKEVSKEDLADVLEFSDLSKLEKVMGALTASAAGVSSPKELKKALKKEAPTKSDPT